MDNSRRPTLANQLLSLKRKVNAGDVLQVTRDRLQRKSPPRSAFASSVLEGSLSSTLSVSVPVESTNDASSGAQPLRPMPPLQAPSQSARPSRYSRELIREVFGDAGSLVADTAPSSGAAGEQADGMGSVLVDAEVAESEEALWHLRQQLWTLEARQRVYTQPKSDSAGNALRHAKRKLNSATHVWATVSKSVDQSPHFSKQQHKRLLSSIADIQAALDDGRRALMSCSTPSATASLLQIRAQALVMLGEAGGQLCGLQAANECLGCPADAGSAALARAEQTLTAAVGAREAAAPHPFNAEALCALLATAQAAEYCVNVAATELEARNASGPELWASSFASMVSHLEATEVRIQSCQQSLVWPKLQASMVSEDYSGFLTTITTASAAVAKAEEAANAARKTAARLSVRTLTADFCGVLAPLVQAAVSLTSAATMAVLLLQRAAYQTLVGLQSIVERLTAPTADRLRPTPTAAFLQIVQQSHTMWAQLAAGHQDAGLDQHFIAAVLAAMQELRFTMIGRGNRMSTAVVQLPVWWIFGVRCVIRIMGFSGPSDWALPILQDMMFVLDGSCSSASTCVQFPAEWLPSSAQLVTQHLQVLPASAVRDTAVQLWRAVCAALEQPAAVAVTKLEQAVVCIASLHKYLWQGATHSLDTVTHRCREISSLLQVAATIDPSRQRALFDHHNKVRSQVVRMAATTVGAGETDPTIVRLVNDLSQLMDNANDQVQMLREEDQDLDAWDSLEVALNEIDEVAATATAAVASLRSARCNDISMQPTPPQGPSAGGRRPRRATKVSELRSASPVQSVVATDSGVAEGADEQLSRAETATVVAPVPEEAHASEEAPAAEEATAADTTLVCEEFPAPEEASAPEEKPAAEEAPAQDTALVSEQSPVSEEAPAAAEAPIPEVVPVPEVAPAAEEAPAPALGPIPDVAPAQDTALVSEVSPVSEEAPAPALAPIPEVAPAPEEAAIPEEAPDANDRDADQTPPNSRLQLLAAELAALQPTEELEELACAQEQVQQAVQGAKDAIAAAMAEIQRSRPPSGETMTRALAAVSRGSSGSPENAARESLLGLSAQIEAMCSYRWWTQSLHVSPHLARCRAQAQAAVSEALALPAQSVTPDVLDRVQQHAADLRSNVEEYFGAAMCMAQLLSNVCVADAVVEVTHASDMPNYVHTNRAQLRAAASPQSAHEFVFSVVKAVRINLGMSLLSPMAGGPSSSLEAPASPHVSRSRALAHACSELAAGLCLSSDAEEVAAEARGGVIEASYGISEQLKAAIETASATEAALLPRILLAMRVLQLQGLTGYLPPMCTVAGLVSVLSGDLSVFPEQLRIVPPADVHMPDWSGPSIAQLHSLSRLAQALLE